MTTGSPEYRGYRKSKGFGVGSLGTKATGAAFGIIILVLFSLFLKQYVFTGILALVALPTLIMIGVPIPLGGTRRTIGQRLAWRLRYWWAGNDQAYVDDVYEEIPRGNNLPGPLAPLCPIDVEDGRGGKQGMLWNRQTGLLSVSLNVSPVGLTLADDDDALAWVTNYGGFLADLGYLPTVDSISFTTETSPTGGMNQRAYTKNRLDQNAPQVCTEILTDLVNQSRATTADVRCTVTVNFDMKKHSPEPETLAAGASEVVSLLPRIESSLSSAGMTVTGRATVADTIARLRAAFDPAIRSADLDPDEELWRWKDGGPLRTEPNPNVFEHDTGYSVSWVMTDMPSSVVRYHILLPLVTPGRYYRRFTMVYRPFGAAEATEQVEKEINSGVLRKMWRRHTKKDETQRDHDDQVAARRAAQQESMGAGLGRFTFYCTTTVRNEETLPAACADVEERMGQTRVRFRRSNMAQPATFAASLGCGIEPAAGLSRNPMHRWGA